MAAADDGIFYIIFIRDELVSVGCAAGRLFVLAFLPFSCVTIIKLPTYNKFAICTMKWYVTLHLFIVVVYSFNSVTFACFSRKLGFKQQQQHQQRQQEICCILTQKLNGTFPPRNYLLYLAYTVEKR